MDLFILTLSCKETGSLVQVASAVGGIVPCIELVTSGFDLGSADDTAAQLAAFRALGPLSLISDNASHGAWIVGACTFPAQNIFRLSIYVSLSLCVFMCLMNALRHR